MTIRTLILAILAAGLLTGGAARAQDRTVGPAVGVTGVTSFSAAGEPQTLSAARISRHIGVETAAPPAVNRNLSQAAQRDFERDQKPIAFGVAYMPVAKDAELYARIGKGGSHDTLTGERDDGWLYGAGAQIGRGDSGFRADYTRQGLPRSDVKADIISFGFVKRF